MSDLLSGDEILDLFVFETEQLIEQLEILLIDSEKERVYNDEAINEIFRIMHTIKGSAALMQFENISTLAHRIEDLFFFIREGNEVVGEDFGKLSDLLLDCTDFIKSEVDCIKDTGKSEGDSEGLKSLLTDFLNTLKGETASSGVRENSAVVENVKKNNDDNKEVPENSLNDNVEGNIYECFVYFKEDSSMANIKAFTIVNNLESMDVAVKYVPEDILDNEESASYIIQNGFYMEVTSQKVKEEIESVIKNASDLKSYKINEKSSSTEVKADAVNQSEDNAKCGDKKEGVTPVKKENKSDSKAKNHHKDANSMISVNVSKLDKLMDLVGELVMSQEMVVQNPDLQGLDLENFTKATRQLQKITDELQDSVMSIRMVPLAPTFMKMNRITRDMSRKLDKDVELKIIGEDTEIDKSIIEHISDPLMHLIRNSVDHGIETKEDRAKTNKPAKGTVTLEGRNLSNEVLIIVKDDGKGLDKEMLINKARKQGILYKNPEDMTDKEIYNLILAPGFSSKEVVTEFSGRGVGMDVVAQNIASVNGSIEIDSVLGEGTTMILRIPLTLAIVGGMNARVGACTYTIPTTSVKEFFKVDKKDIVNDIEGNEMVMVRGECYPVIRLHELYGVQTDVTSLEDGIIMMVEGKDGYICLFVDELLGGQQVVVKSLPKYIEKIRGISGCTILGDGSFSLILDVVNLV